MLPFWIFVVFMGSLVIGSLIADALGKLPTAEERTIAITPRQRTDRRLRRVG